ncbi:MAG: hypothetical protein M3N45_09285 [Actinomycetota bacterium]|nr:hypothetical protein [Actinomycetota bacterium]
MEDQRFRNRLVAVLCEEWEKATPGPLPSEAIYERLVGEGTEGEEGAISAVLEGLTNAGLITTTARHDRAARRKHGDWVISGVRTDLLC